MKTFAVFSLLVVAALLASALLTPPIAWIFNVPVDSLLTKMGKLLLILGIIPWLIKLHLNSWQAAGLSLSRRSFVQEYLTGLGIGILSLALLAGLLLWLGVRTWDAQTSLSILTMAKLVVVGLGIGTLVALMEEVFFRGFLHSGMTRSTSVFTATACSALLYAAMHFIRSKDTLLTDNGYWSGLEMVGQIAMNLFRPENLDGFFCLVAVGVVLSMVRIERGNIAMAIGIHAGWVTVIKCMKDLSDANTSSPYAFLISDYDGITGWLGFVYLSLLAALLLLFRLRTRHLLG